MPFTTEEFLRIFETYNTGVWPAQIFAYVLGILAVILLFTKVRMSGRVIAGILSLMWIWTGALYHITYFSEINRPAYVFGALFIIQGLVFAWSGIIRNNLSFRFTPNINSYIGLLFIVYAMLIYPMLGASLGHAWPQNPAFGIAPCPLAIFTFGLLMVTDRHFSNWILLIPFLWAVIGTFAAINLGIYEDYGLMIAGLVGTALLFLRNRKPEVSSELRSETEKIGVQA